MKRLIYSIFLLSACNILGPKRLDFAQVQNLDCEIADSRPKTLSGTFRIKAYRGLAGADLDLIAQTPSSLYLSFRSFVAQPLQTLAYDGKNYFLLDPALNPLPQRLNASLAREVMQEQIGVFVDPSVWVCLLLACPHLAFNSSLQTSYFSRKKHYEVQFDHEKKGLFSLVFKKSPYQPIRASYESYTSDLKINVDYVAYRMLGAFWVPSKWQMHVSQAKKNIHFELDAVELESSFLPYVPEIFRLRLEEE